jgi:hypothetical protein
MPRRKRHDTIRELHREAIRRQSALLVIAIDAATLGLKHFSPHGQALAELRAASWKLTTSFTTGRVISSG